MTGEPSTAVDSSADPAPGAAQADPGTTDVAVGWPGSDAVGLRPELAAGLEAITAKSAERLPGRLEALLSTRFAQLRGLVPVDAMLAAELDRWPSSDGLTTAEKSVIDLAEKFMLDVRAIGPDTFAGLKVHYDDDQLSAICFRLALLEGMTKFDRIFPGGDS